MGLWGHTAQGILSARVSLWHAGRDHFQIVSAFHRFLNCCKVAGGFQILSNITSAKITKSIVVLQSYGSEL